MKITIYELLGLVKDGKAPKKIKYGNIELEYDEGCVDYYKYCSKGLFEYIFTTCNDFLNDEVEIIEEPKKIPEKLPKWATTREDKEYTNQEAHILVVSQKINEIIDYLKSKGE